jgi:hypothetical protein
MKKQIVLVSIIFGLSAASATFGQDSQKPLSVDDILHRADSVSSAQDSLFKDTKYQFKEEVIFNELESNGNTKKADTTISLVTMQGQKELSREIIYPKDKPQKKEDEQKGEVGFSFSANNPDQSFSLAGTNDSTYLIAVVPKANPPKKGAVKGTIEIDKRSYITRKIDMDVPKPEGALKEFSSQVNFEPLEGGLIVMKDMQMKGFAKAMLGIFKIRFTGTVRHSEYKIVD